MHTIVEVMTGSFIRDLDLTFYKKENNFSFIVTFSLNSNRCSY